MTEAEKRLIREALVWKRTWDATGFPGPGVATNTTNTDAELLQYEADVLARALAPGLLA